MLQACFGWIYKCQLGCARSCYISYISLDIIQFRFTIRIPTLDKTIRPYTVSVNHIDTSKVGGHPTSFIVWQRQGPIWHATGLLHSWWLTSMSQSTLNAMTRMHKVIQNYTKICAKCIHMCDLCNTDLCFR